MPATQNKWKENGGSSSFKRSFGPLTVFVDRKWHATPEPEGYKVFFTTIEAETFIPMSECIPPGCCWADDETEAQALKLAEKWVKKIIRSWAK